MINQIINVTSSIESYITNIGDSAWVADIKWLGGFIVLIFGGLVILLIVKLQIFDKWLKMARNFWVAKSLPPKKYLNKSWQNILSRLEKNDEANLRLALIEADNLFDDLLKKMGLSGESMADRLKLLDSSKISNIEEIWRAHKLRNTIVHNYEYPIVSNEIRFGVKAYEKALQELEFLD